MMSQVLKYERSVEDAQQVIKLAKVKLEDVYPVTQVFHLPSIEETNSAKTHIKMMDVDEEFIKKLEEGERFVFRGTDNEKLVLCSDTETYDVKDAEISNALVIVPELLYAGNLASRPAGSHEVVGKSIKAIKHSYLELRPTFPKLRKLREVMTEAAYKGPDREENGEKGHFLCDLLEIVQCSREQLLTALGEMCACRLDNKWRLLDVEYESRVLSDIITLTEENLGGKLGKSDVFDVLQSTVPEPVLSHIFTHFTQPVAPDNDDDREWVKEKVSRSFAEMLLRAGQGKFRYNDFIMAWSQCLPKGLEADISTLRGLAIVEQQSATQNVVHLFPEYILPEQVGERFRLLFMKREKWTLQEIEPYIEKLATASMNISTMLTKFSRASTINGVRVFGPRLR